MPGKPEFKHDCTPPEPGSDDGCVYVGTASLGGQVFDLYFHKRNHSTEFILRYGNNGPEYLCLTHWN